jgi:LEA14-like dessication related protein
MTLILRSHVTLCSEKTRINIAVRGRVKGGVMDYMVCMNNVDKEDLRGAIED